MISSTQGSNIHGSRDIEAEGHGAAAVVGQSVMPSATTNTVQVPPDPKPGCGGHVDSANPSDGARDSAPAQGNGYAKDPETAIKDSLAANSTYQTAKNNIALVDSMQADIALIERSVGGVFGNAEFNTSDGNLWIRDIEKATSPQYSPEIRAAAKRLLQNRGLLEQLQDSGSNINASTINAYKQRQQSVMNGIEQATRTGIGHSGHAATGGVTPNPETPAADPVKTQPQPNPGAGTKDDPVKGNGQDGKIGIAENRSGGVTGFCEALGETQDKLYAEVDTLTTSMEGKSPEECQQIMAKITKVTQQIQMLSNLQNQLMTMISNISKMFSDIAMNAVRNVR